MADTLDDAQMQADYLNTVAIDAALDRARKAAFAGQGSEICCDCAELIPELRRLANPQARRCIECQNDYERSHG